MAKNDNHKTYFDEIFKEKIDRIYQEFSNEWDQQSFISDFDLAQQSVSKNKKNLKGKYSLPFLVFYAIFVFPISIALLIFPVYWAIKYFRKILAERKVFKNNLDNSFNEKLGIQQQILTSDIFEKYYLKINELLEYQKIGPLTNELVTLLKDQSLFNLSVDRNSNPWESSWGIYKKNKLILTMSNQSFEMVNVRYTGSISVSYRIGDKTYYKTITAEYIHPAPSIKKQIKRFLYTNNCANLVFNYGDKSKSIFSKKVKRDPLENKEFDKKFSWSRNDEVQFRMIFTPLMQERYLNEYYANNKNLGDEDLYFKEADYISNEFKGAWTVRKLNLKVISLFQDFFFNHEAKIEDFKLGYFNILYEWFINQYKQMKYLYFIPFVESINDVNLVNRALSMQLKNQESFVFYIISTIIGKNIFKIDVEPFFRIISTSNKNGIECAQVQIVTFRKVQKTKYVFSEGHSVPVDYIDYQKAIKEVSIYYSFTNRNAFYRPFVHGKNFLSNCRNITNDVLNVLNETKDKTDRDILIQDGFIVAYEVDGTLSNELLMEKIKEVKGKIN